MYQMEVQCGHRLRVLGEVRKNEECLAVVEGKEERGLKCGDRLRVLGEVGSTEEGSGL